MLRKVVPMCNESGKMMWFIFESEIEKSDPGYGNPGSDWTNLFKKHAKTAVTGTCIFELFDIKTGLNAIKMIGMHEGEAEQLSPEAASINRWNINSRMHKYLLNQSYALLMQVLQNKTADLDEFKMNDDWNQINFN